MTMIQTPRLLVPDQLLVQMCAPKQVEFGFGFFLLSLLRPHTAFFFLFGRFRILGGGQEFLARGQMDGWTDQSNSGNGQEGNYFQISFVAFPISEMFLLVHRDMLLEVRDVI